jgi:hypothetical protein
LPTFGSDADAFTAVLAPEIAAERFGLRLVGIF